MLGKQYAARVTDERQRWKFGEDEATSPEAAFRHWLPVHRGEHDPKLTQAALAEKIGFDPTAVAKIERGTRSIRLNEAVALADALGKDLTDMITPPPTQTLRDQLAIVEGQLQRAVNQIKSGEKQREIMEKFAADLRKRIAEEEAGVDGEH